MEMLGRDEMILKVRGLNVITGDLIIVWPRNETKLSRRPSAAAYANCVPKRDFRRKPSRWTVISTARTSAASSAVNATSALSILKRSPWHWTCQCVSCSNRDENCSEETLLSRGQYAGSAEWKTTRKSLYKAIREVDWPRGSGTFTIYPESGKARGKGNGGHADQVGPDGKTTATGMEARRTTGYSGPAKTRKTGRSS